ncbi:MAG: helicase-associated domain-containing protein [Longimicrobiaceae bacterium]
MKVHELDWQVVLGALPRWEALSPGGRRAFLGIRPGQPFSLESLGGAGPELEAAGLLIAPTGRGTLYGLDPALRPLLVALRAAQRLHPLHGEGGALRIEYVQDQLSSPQAQAIGAPAQRGYYHSADRRLAAEAASSVAWVREFLAAGTHAELVRWEGRRLPEAERPRLVFPLVAEALRALVQALAPHRGGMPLRALPELLPAASPATRAAALAAGLRYLLVFVSIGGDAEAVVGLLPAVAARLAGAPSPPGPVEAREPFAAPFRVGDVTALLVEAATEPIAVRAADHTLYVRAQRAIAARLAWTPPWVERFADTGSVAGAGGADEGDSARLARVEWAAHLASMLRLVKLRSAGDRLALAPTPAGRAWLNRSEDEHLKEVLATLRALPQRTPAAHGDPEKLDFFGAPLPFQVEEKKHDLRAALSAAFLSAPPGALVSVAAFLRFQAQERNPFLGPDGPTPHVRAWWSSLPRTVEGWEEAWGNLLLTFLARRLVPLGCATLARAGNGLAFGLTDAGRYLLGAADDFVLAPAGAEGEVVVQPDFEVVFLAPAPRAEAELGRIAERTGAGVGALFRLTRASVLRAAEQGMSVGQVLETLESLARSGVPANVARQVRDWMQSVRTVRIAPAVLVECPDPETAGRVRALGGAGVKEVTPTLLRLEADAKTRAALVKRLRERGIFVAAQDAQATS